MLPVFPILKLYVDNPVKSVTHRIICLTLSLFVHIPFLWAQNRITVNLQQVSIDSIKTVWERQTDYSVYYIPSQTDSLRLNLHAANEDPVAVLQRVLAAYEFSVSVAGRQIFILKGVPLSMTLPLDYFEIKRKNMDNFQVISALEQEKEMVTAQSESKLYIIGAPLTAGAVGRVILRGYLKDIKTGEPLPGIMVYTEGPDVNTSSDMYGFYSLSLPRGEHKVNYKGYGFTDTYRLVQMNSNGNLDVELSEKVYSLTGAVVSAEQMVNIRGTQIGIDKISIDRIKHIPSVFGESDVGKVVLTLPGVKSVGEASGGFNVRGGATDQNLILFNDGTVYYPSHLFGLFSSFNPDIVSDIELYKSSIPANYGGRISSVLDVNTRDGNKKKITGSAGIGVLTNKLHLEGPFVENRSSFILGARTTYSDWILKMLPQESGYQNGSASFYDLNGSTAYKIGETDQLYLSAYYSKDKFKFDAFTSYRYQNDNFSARWRHQVGTRFFILTSLGYDQYSYETEDVANPVNAYRAAFGIDQLFGKINVNWIMNEKHTFRFGINTNFYMIQPGSYLPNGKQSIVAPDRLEWERATENAFFIRDSWNISNKLSVDAGIRFSLFSALGPRSYYKYRAGAPKTEWTITDTVHAGGGRLIKPYMGPEFRISARYIIRPDLSVKAGFNSMRQYIHMLSNNTSASPLDTWKLSDANIVPQAGWQAAGGIYKNFANNTIEVSLEGYFKMMNHYLDYRSGAVLTMNPHIETDVVEARGKAYGLELLVKKNLGKLNGWFSYTYSRTLLQQNDRTAPTLVNNGDWYPAAYDKPHDLKLIGNYKFTHRYNASLNVDYATGRPVTIPVSKYIYGNGYRLFYSERNAYRIPDYFRMDLALNIEPGHHLTVFTHSTITIGVYNLTGRKNAYSVYYSANGGERVRGYMLTIFGAPIPYISFNLKFN